MLIDPKLACDQTIEHVTTIGAEILSPGIELVNAIRGEGDVNAAGARFLWRWGDGVFFAGVEEPSSQALDDFTAARGLDLSPLVQPLH